MATDILDSSISNGAGGDDWADTGYSTGGGIPPQQVIRNPDGTKTVKDYSMSEDGYLAITTTKYKVEKLTKTVSKGVASRKGWKKFGDCLGKAPGLESGVSTVSIDEINVEWISNDDGDGDDEEEDNYAEIAARDIQSKLKLERFRQRIEERKMGVANWAQKMSIEAAAKTNPGSALSAQFSMNDAGNNPNFSTASSLGGASASGSIGGGAGGKYVPPSKRLGVSGSSMPSAGESMYSRDDSATVRISNVSKSTEEADLDELCKVFGPIRRIFLSRDRETGESKGFAFVAFQNKSDAEKCINRLDGYGYDHLILSVEWSKPKEPKDGESRSSFSR